MKTIAHYMILTVIAMTIAQVAKGQTFDLGLAAEDSTMVKFVDSILAEYGVIFIASDSIAQNSSRRTPPADEKEDPGDGGLRIPPLQPSLHPHIPNSFPINTGKTVGEIPIQHHVTAFGATTYAVPIECAPGRAGLQPAVSLIYNSLGGNGVLGMGWNIGGLSSIRRAASNYYYDGTAQPAEMTATAKFVLDGERLIQTATSSTVRTFAPEQGNVKIEAYMNGAVTKYFKVWFSNGSTAIYGDATNTTANKLEYPITLMTDVLGNTIKFIYTELNGHYYISEIKYGSSKTITNDYASIKFFYKTRTDVYSEWEAGTELSENRLLDYIQCINNSTTIRTYNFTYTLNRVSLLTQIDCNLSSGSLNPLKFFYGTDNPPTQINKTTSQLTDLPATTTGWVVNKGKTNKWGDDVLMVYRKLDPYYEQNSKYKSLYPTSESLRIYSSLAGSTVNPDVLTTGAGFVELTSADIDGKSGDELIKINNNVSGTSDQVTFTVYKPATTGYTTYKTVNYTPMTAIGDTAKSATPKVFLTGDFAGIGRLQVLAVSRYNPLGTANASKIMVFDLEAGKTLCNITAPFNFNGNNTSSDLVFAMDYDGDGRAEIAHKQGTNISIYAFSGTDPLTLTKVASISLSTLLANNCMLIVGDINGDGKTDLLFTPPINLTDNQWKAYYAKGKGDANGTNGFDIKTHTLFEHKSNASYMLHDVNNDGMADLVRSYNGAITVYPATGSGISATPESATATAVSGAILIPTVVSQENNYTRMLSLNSGSIDKYVFTRNDTRERMISAAVNSLGIIVKSDYKRLEDQNSSIYTPGSAENFPYENMNAYFWATSHAQTIYNDALKYSFVYQYTKAITHRQGLGFLGFEIFSATGLRSSVTQTFEPKNYGVLKKVETPTSLTENTYTFSTATNKIATVRLTKQKVTDLLKSNVITTDYASFDAYNQPKTVTTEYGTGSGVKTKWEYVFNNYDSGSGSSRVYVLGLPGEEKITNTRGGASWIDKTTIIYNSGYLPATKTGYTGTAGTAQTAYETFVYDEGNLITHTFKPYSSSKTQTVSYAYDTNKRLLKTVTDVMGRITTYDVYDSYGRLTKLKDFMNQTTTFEYDVLDRQTKVISPSGAGVTVQNVFAWNSANNGSVMSVTTTTTKRPTSVKYTDAFGRTTRESVMGFNGTYIHTDYDYDQHGRLTQKTDPYTSTKRYTTYEYDTYDRVKKITSPAGRITTITYSGNTVTTVDAGMSTSKTFDASGALVSSTDPAGTITYTLKADGQPSKIKTPDNVETTFGYDTYGRQTSIIDPSAGEIQYAYNPEGWLLKQTNARNQETTYLYEDWGAVKKITTPEQVIDYTYHTTYKRLEKIKSGTHFEVNFAYDALGRVNKETEKEGTITLVKDYTFDAGRVATVKYNSVANDVLTYTYNSSGYLSNMKFGTTVVYTVNERDHFGQLKKYTLGNGAETNRTYSDYGTPATMLTKKGTVEWVNQTYQFDDTKGLLAKRQDFANGGAIESFNYNSHRQLLTYGTTAVNNTMGYSTMGNITSKTDAGTFLYNVSGKPYTLGQHTPPALQTVQARYIRSGMNGAGSASSSNHWIEIQAINSAGTNLALGKTVTSSTSTITNAQLVTDGSTANESFARTATGNYETVSIDLGQTQNIAEVKVWNYYRDWRGYNSLKTEISTNGTSWTALYDAGVSGTYKETPLGRSYGPNAGRPLGTRTVTYTSDEKPNTIVTNGLTASFKYNHAGQRTLMELTHADARAHSIHYLGGNYEREARYNTITERLYIGGTPYDAPAVAIRTNGGAWAIHYIHRDYLGSICAVSNATGAVVEKRSYDAWGRLRKPTTLQPYGPGEQPSLFLNRGYTGHEHLPEFGLINMNARLYDPLIGRMLSPDPYVADPTYSQDYNRYIYARNNPFSYTDPTGEKLKWWQWAAIGLGLDALTGGAISATAIATTTTTAATAFGTVAATASATAANALGVVGATAGAAFTSADISTGGILSSTLLSGAATTASPTAAVADFGRIFFGTLFSGDTQKGGKDFGNWLKIQAGQLMHVPGLQTMLGNSLTHYKHLRGKVDNVTLGPGYVIIEDYSSGMGVTLGPYINIGNVDTKFKNPWLVHEFGHIVQSNILGPLYMSKVAIPSGISMQFDLWGFHNHDNDWFEINANQLGRMFFNPTFENDSKREHYSRSFSKIDWWFLLFNPFLF